MKYFILPLIPLVVAIDCLAAPLGVEPDSIRNSLSDAWRAWKEM